MTIRAVSPRKQLHSLVMQVKSRRQLLLDYREALLEELVSIANNRSRAEYLVRALHQNDKDLSSGEGAFTGKRTVGSIIYAHLLAVGHGVPLEELKEALVPGSDDSPEVSAGRANVGRSVKRSMEMGGQLVLRKDGIVDLRKWPK